MSETPSTRATAPCRTMDGKAATIAVSGPTQALGCEFPGVRLTILTEDGRRIDTFEFSASKITDMGGPVGPTSILLTVGETIDGDGAWYEDHRCDELAVIMHWDHAVISYRIREFDAIAQMFESGITVILDRMGRDALLAAVREAA